MLAVGFPAHCALCPGLINRLTVNPICVVRGLAALLQERNSNSLARIISRLTYITYYSYCSARLSHPSSATSPLLDLVPCVLCVLVSPLALACIRMMILSLGTPPPGVCDTPELWCGAAGLCARVRACASAAESLHTYIQLPPPTLTPNTTHSSETVSLLDVNYRL